MTTWYARRIKELENKLCLQATNRVVRPFEWGLEWAHGWPHARHIRPNGSPEHYLRELNLAALHDSETFYGYEKPSDFQLDGDTLRFTSRVTTPYPENDAVHARYFPAKSKRAVVVLPHWNAPASSPLGLCRGLQKLGIASVRISLPYHDFRMPPELQRADYAVSSNIGRTIDATRQAVIDVRCCFDWLESQGYNRLGIIGTSLGSCYACLVSTHDPRVSVNVFNHCSTHFADVVWAGISTRHIRQGLEGHVDVERLRELWKAISPVNYLDKFSKRDCRSLFIYTTYDTTFPPELSRDIIRRMREFKVDHKVVVLPCGHYTMGITPFKYLDGYHICSFLMKTL